MELIAVGGMVFSLLVVAFVFIEILCLSEDRYVPATIVGLVFFALLQFATTLNPWLFVKTNPVYILLGVVGYLGVGTGWSIFKWRNFIIKKIEAYQKEVEYSKQYHTRIPDKLARINVSTYKSKIIGWMAYWPFSFVAYFVGDLLADLFKWIFNQIKGFLQSIADKLYEKYMPKD